MATYSYSGSTTTTNYGYYDDRGKTYYSGKAKNDPIHNIKCGNCGFNMASRVSDKTVRMCIKCKEYITHEGKKAETKFFNEFADETVKPTTHIQVKWRCRECGSHGIRWRPKKGYREGMECRECGCTNLMTNVMPTAGNRGSIWGKSMAGGRGRPSMPHMVISCQNCGYHHQYGYHRPKTCTECGHSFPPEEDSPF